MKIYLGPWQYLAKSKIYHRPLLNEFFTHKSGCLAAREAPKLYPGLGYKWEFTFGDKIYSGGLHKMMREMDRLIEERGYNEPHNVVFLTQEQFDKLRILL